MYLGQKPEEHGFSSQKRCLEVKQDDFEEKNIMEQNMWSEIDFSIKFLDDSAWFCMEKLKKHSFDKKNN